MTQWFKLNGANLQIKMKMQRKATVSKVFTHTHCKICATLIVSNNLLTKQQSYQNDPVAHRLRAARSVVRVCRARQSCAIVVRTLISEPQAFAIDDMTYRHECHYPDTFIVHTIELQYVRLPQFVLTPTMSCNEEL